MGTVEKSIRIVNGEVVMSLRRYEQLQDELRIWRGLHFHGPKLLTELQEWYDRLARHASRINLMSRMDEDDKTSPAYRVSNL